MGMGDWGSCSMNRIMEVSNEVPEVPDDMMSNAKQPALREHHAGHHRCFAMLLAFDVISMPPFEQADGHLGYSQ
ncbi:hypothetical protein PAAG_11866 [Paracoccidioides lutzii Pb01]|uniref:Uncharacterized protein n=1 Tax=Paracoccidioides lutzii (strain ATCC MYA-826 / Pb01) TaxID=502779 RepID=A0A0A2V4V8_PARBA|nr:hypothetical protein PAAG_11866 [Paracoccidioides lutzii Pb01]KGQ01402.1 hypothetical protein PAAG_11866 [Paracoccidioides lutzii Pb01]